MYNTLRTIIFIVSTVITYLVYPLIQQATYFLVDTTLGGSLSDNQLLTVYGGFVIIFVFLTFAGLQAITRQVLLYRHSKDNAIMSFPITFFSAADRSIYYIVPFLAHLFPLLRGTLVTEVMFMKIGFFVITLFLFHIIIEFSKKRTRVYFLKSV